MKGSIKMQVFSNLWGGEGLLTSASLLAMASVGMFNDIKDNNDDTMKIYYRCFDFSQRSPDENRWKNMRDSYEKYSRIIFGNDACNCLINDDINITRFVNTTPPQISQKYQDKGSLALGFSEDEMDLNISRGIYGRPWIGEAYYADTDFSCLYNNAEPNILVINGGGYKGGGTAASFIYLENRFDVQNKVQNVNQVKRFDVIVGPSTQFDRFIKLPHPEIYNETNLRDNIDIFKVGDIIENLENKNGISATDQGHHNANIAFLKKVWNDISSSGRDYTALNPKNYMPRFIDRVSSDTTLKKVVPFINMKYPLQANGDSYDYDITSDGFAADNQKHKLHITNMLSAVTIQEIALNHNSPNYDENGHIFSFCIPNASKYTIDGVFRPEDAVKFYRFLAFSVMIVKYIYNCFYDIQKPGAAIMLDKWAISKKHILLGLRVILKEETNEGKLNFAFARNVKAYLANFASEYIKPVLEAFKDIEDTSENVQFFSKTRIAENLEKGMYGIICNLIDSIYIDNQTNADIKEIDNPSSINKETESILAAVITGRPGKPEQFNDSYRTIKGENGGTNFLEIYQTGLPEFGTVNGKKERIWSEDINENNVKEKAVKYCEALITYTYSKIQEKLI